MPARFTTLVTCTTCLYVLASFFAVCPAAEDSYADMDKWERFNDREVSHGKTKSNFVLPLPTSTAAKPPASEPGHKYVIVPGSPPPPQVRETVQTTYAPTVVPNGLYGNSWYSGLNRPYWRSIGPAWGPWSPAGYSAPYSVTMRPITTITRQTVPSASTGGYYNGPGSSGLGTYYASPAGLPKAAPIIEDAPPQADYWGPNGNPLPTDMRP